MCGIAGFLTSGRSNPDRSLLARMCGRLVHRGPDADGYFCAPGAALGHRRLSIIDVAGGHQPLGNEDGSLQIVFNGEIYNYQELRRDLIGKGHQFATRSDTEVLVHLYEEAGERMPEYLNGMFAFALWDARRRELFLARDRFGEKPLYYTFAAPGFPFCFASELKAFAVLPGFDPPLNPRALTDFLALSYIPDPETIYDNVSRLEPGHSLTVSAAGGGRRRRYWMPVFESGTTPSLDAAVEETRALAADAVERRMISDVPLGAFLSGGVDSSAVVACMASSAGPRVNTFSIGFTDKSFDELPYARLVAERYRTHHREQVVTPSIDEVLPVLADHFDEPFGDSSAIPMLYLARMTRRHVTVALSGDGADELFAGYRRYYFGHLEQRIGALLPDWAKRTVVPLSARLYPKLDWMPRVFRAKTLLHNLSQQIGDAYFTSMSTFRDEGLEQVLSPHLRREALDAPPRARFRNRFAAVSHLPPLEQMQAVDLETYLPGDILVKTDRTTMAYSLEGRAPWLDHRLAELACRLPAAYKLNGTSGKHVFRQAVRPYLPPPLLSRPKMGFSVPLASWFRTRLRPLFESQVLDPQMEQYLSLDRVRVLWDEHQSGLHNHDRKLWNLFMLAVWDTRWRRAGSSEALAEQGVAAQ